MSEFLYNGKKYYEPEMDTQLAFEAVDIYTFRYYPQDKIIIASDVVVERFGVSKVVFDIKKELAKGNISSEESHKVIDIFKAIDKGEKKVGTKLYSNDRKRKFELTLSTLESDDDGKPVIVAGIVVNLYDDVRKRDAIYALSTNFSNIFYIDFEEDCVYPYRVNQSVKEFFDADLSQYENYENIMKAFVKMAVFNEDIDDMLFETSIENLQSEFEKKETYQYDFRINNKNGIIQYCRAKFVNITEGDGLKYMIVGFADISEEKQKELERIAYVDSLTGGDNYVSFKKKISDSKKSGHLVSMDIHSFKLINSICGIAKGDETLKEIWRGIKRTLKEDDLAGHINADRFVIFIANDSIKEVAEQISLIEKEVIKMAEILNIPTVLPYFGVTVWVPGGNAEKSYNEANFAKNQIKDRKDIYYKVYSSRETEKILREKDMEDSFHNSLQKGEFQVWYQPKYDPNTNEMIEAEALVRWCRNETEVVSPENFIPLFERDGLIRILDEYVFATVCRQQMEWKAQGRKLVPVSINVSRASLYFDDIVNHYDMIAADAGIDKKHIPLEITESAAIDNKNIIDISDSFHDRGFVLQVDDFGAGYSSLATLNMNCFDVLKIDKSLIDYIGDKSGESLLRHTISLAKELGLKVTAEGVESENQVAFLKGVKIDSIQGAFYNMPMPVYEFENLL